MRPPIESTDRKIVWVLPNRDQSGEDNVLVNGLPCRLAEALDVTKLPKCLVLGIPEEAVEKYGDDEKLVFAQFIRQPELRRSIYSLSVICGRDRTDRIVFLTLLQLFPINELPQGVPTEPLLPPEEAEGAAKLQQRMRVGTDKWVKSVRRLLSGARSYPTLASFANVALHRMHYQPDWTPQKKTSPSPKEFS